MIKDTPEEDSCGGSFFLTNCRVFCNNRIIDANLLIESGKISKITKARLDSATILNLNGNLVLPGAIDSHVHFREPGQKHKEGWITGSNAAAAGGVTTVLDMPNNIPPITTIRLLEEKRKLAGKSAVNYGFHFAASDKLGEINSAERIASVKAYMNETTNMEPVKIPVLKKIIDLNKLVTVHAEGEKINDIAKSASSKNRIHVAHVNTKSQVNLISRFRNIFSAEVTPHHLYLCREDALGLKGFGNVKPLIGSDRDRAALWNALREGIIDTVASDHAPHTAEEKESENPPYGMPGVETMLPLMLHAVNKKHIKINDLVRVCCGNPARIFRLENKGFIREGCDADLVVVDMKKTGRILNSNLKTKCGWSAFDRMRIKGWPIATFVNGVLVYESGESIGRAGKEVEYY